MAPVVSQGSDRCSPTAHALFCRGLSQCEKKDADVVVQQIDRVAIILPEAFLVERRLGVP